MKAREKTELVPVVGGRERVAGAPSSSIDSYAGLNTRTFPTLPGFLRTQSGQPYMHPYNFPPITPSLSLYLFSIPLRQDTVQPL